MNPFWTEIIIQTAGSNTKKEKRETYSGYKLAKKFREFKITGIRLIKDFILITLGIFSAAFGFKGFLLSNHFNCCGISAL